MRVIVFLIAAGGLVAGGFLCAFAWAVRSGQFDDTTTPPLRILFDDAEPSASIASEGPVHVHLRR
jgi:cbb3-type cytochrome oxidase maturation protein